jgi:hypothetical protein
MGTRPLSRWRPHHSIPNNKPAIRISDNEKRTCMLIDVAISGDRNVIKKKAEIILKYKGNSISKLQIQVATYVFELSAGNCHR